jgi:hypothetical protein
MPESIRRPPAYQEYGSDLLGLEDIRLMSLAERGLLATLRWYLWANDTAPRDAQHLARVLGLDGREVAAALTERVLRSFEQCTEDASRLYSRELSAQMTRIMERRVERSESGRKGGKASARRRNGPQAQLGAQPQAQLGAVVKLAEMKGDERRRGELARKADPSEEEVLEMRRAFGEPC